MTPEERERFLLKIAYRNEETERHYSTEHGRWCCYLKDLGILDEGHVRCAQWYIADTYHT